MKTTVYCITFIMDWAGDQTGHTGFKLQDDYRTIRVDASTLKSAITKARKEIKETWPESEPKHCEPVGACHLVPGGDIEMDI